MEYPFRHRRERGIESRKVRRSAKGWVSKSPVMPKLEGSQKISGRKKQPCRAPAKREAEKRCPVACKKRLVTEMEPWRISATQVKRRAKLPREITVGSVSNSLITVVASRAVGIETMGMRAEENTSAKR